MEGRWSSWAAGIAGTTVTVRLPRRANGASGEKRNASGRLQISGSSPGVGIYSGSTQSFPISREILAGSAGSSQPEIRCSPRGSLSPGIQSLAGACGRQAYRRGRGRIERERQDSQHLQKSHTEQTGPQIDSRPRALCDRAQALLTSPNERLSGTRHRATPLPGSCCRISMTACGKSEPKSDVYPPESGTSSPAVSNRSSPSTAPYRRPTARL